MKKNTAGSRAWASLGGVRLCMCMAIHHNRLGVLGILGVGMVGIGEGDVQEGRMLHHVWRTRFDWGPWRSLGGSVGEALSGYSPGFIAE